LFKKPGGVTAARSIWETQFAAALRVVSFQSAVVRESQSHRNTRLNSTSINADRSADGTETRSFLIELRAVFKGCAHRYMARLKACFENRCGW
jgi:hypothetical protein